MATKLNLKSKTTLADRYNNLKRMTSINTSSKDYMM